MKKISIVMSYFNRYFQLKNTLDSIKYYNSNDNNIEIVIVDDASNEENRVEQLINNYNYNFKIVRINPDQKKHVNPCVPYNIGFKHASGEIVIIQNPECAHFGNVVEYSKNIEKNDYLVFHCYSLDKETTDKLFLEKTQIQFLQKSVYFDGDLGYYAHKIHRPKPYHFCSVINKKDLDDLNGFDERYSNGCGYDDDEFLERIRRKGLNLKWIENPMVLHQWHTKFNSSIIPSNYDLFTNVTCKETTWRANI